MSSARKESVLSTIRESAHPGKVKLDRAFDLRENQHKLG